MTANMTTGRVRRESTVCVRSVKATLAATVLAGIIGTLCVARVAAAEPAPLTHADFAGRWLSKREELTLDIARCGKDWCGVVVTGNACGSTGLRVSEKSEDAQYQTGKNRELTGRLQLAASTEPYGVRAMLTRDDGGALVLHIGGHTGGYSPVRRTYDYNEVFARIGDAACAPNPKTS